MADDRETAPADIGIPISTTADLRCDAPGCLDPIAVRQGGEQLCFAHAMERGNAERAKRGLPPVTIDEEGDIHVCQ